MFLLWCLRMTVLADFLKNTKLKSETSNATYTLSPTSTIACIKIQTGTFNHVQCSLYYLILQNLKDI